MQLCTAVNLKWALDCACIHQTLNSYISTCNTFDKQFSGGVTSISAVPLCISSRAVCSELNGGHIVTGAAPAERKNKFIHIFINIKTLLAGENCTKFNLNQMAGWCGNGCSTLFMTCIVSMFVDITVCFLLVIIAFFLNKNQLNVPEYTQIL